MDDNTLYATAALVAAGLKPDGDAAASLKAIGELVRASAPEDPKIAQLLGGEEVADEPGP